MRSDNNFTAKEAKAIADEVSIKNAKNEKEREEEEFSTFFNLNKELYGKKLALIKRMISENANKGFHSYNFAITLSRFIDYDGIEVSDRSYPCQKTTTMIMGFLERLFNEFEKDGFQRGKIEILEYHCSCSGEDMCSHDRPYYYVESSISW